MYAAVFGATTLEPSPMPSWLTGLISFSPWYSSSQTEFGRQEYDRKRWALRQYAGVGGSTLLTPVYLRRAYVQEEGMHLWRESMF